MPFEDILQKALTLHQQGNLDEAEVLYRQILETAPENVPVMHFLAMIAVSKGAYESAIALLYKAVELDGKAAAPRFNLAMALQGAGYNNEALEQYKKAIKLDKDFSGEGYNNIANIYRFAGDLKKAEKYYKEAIKFAPDKAFYAFNGLGLLQREQGKDEQSLESFQKAIDIEPTSADAYANMAATLRSMGRLFEALPLYEKALQTDGHNPVIYTGYGIALELDGKIDDAFAAYTKAIEISPEYADAYAHRGSILLGQNKIKQAVSDLRKATELNKEHGEAWLDLGVALYKDGLYLEAMEAYRKAIILNPDNPEVCNNLAIAVHQAGDLKEAAGLCFNALALDKDFAEVHNTLAAILGDMYKEDKELAIGTAKAWVKHCPKNKIAAHTLAAFINDNSKEKASPEYLKEHFDGFAETFDTTLSALKYKAPDLIADEIKRLKIKNAVILDLGCGTGLCGQRLRELSSTLRGLDVSPLMLDKARRTNIYDELVESEAEEYLEHIKNEYDIISAADVLCYFGRLDNIFQAIRQALKAGGAFVFTLEQNTKTDDDYLLQPSGRFCHTERYARSQLEKIGFHNITVTSATIRFEDKNQVSGMLISARI